MKEDVFTQSPHRENSLKVVLLSDMKCNTSLYNKEAWEKTVTLMKEAYGSDKKGYLFIVDGVFESPALNSKYEFLRMPAYSTAHSQDWFHNIQEEFKKVPKNVEIHYFYGKNDISNMVEIYNSKIWEFVEKGKGLSSSFKKIEGILYKDIFHLFNSDVAHKNKQLEQKKANNFFAKLNFELAEFGRKVDEFSNVLPVKYVQQASSQLSKDMQTLGNIVAKNLKEERVSSSSSKKLLSCLVNVTDKLERVKGDFAASYFPLEGKFVRKNVPAEMKKQLLLWAKGEYEHTLSSLVENERQFHIHKFKNNYVPLDFEKKEVLFEVSGFHSLANAALSRLRKEEYERLSRTPHEFDELSPRNKNHLEQLGLTSKDLADVVEQEKLGQKPPDFKIIGNDFVFRTMACSFSNEKIEPTYMISLAPFYDVEKARSLSKLSYLDKKNIEKAFRVGASSGILLLDYTPQSLRITPMNLSQIALVKDTLNNIHITDIHSGKEDQRTDLNLAIAYVKKKDRSIESCDETGDRFQSLNYPGSAQEGTNRLARIDDQIIRDVVIHQQADEEIVKRSRLKNAIIRKLKGNHDRPLEPLGMSPSKMEVFYLNLPYINAKGISEQELYYAHRLKELGYHTVLDDLPYQTNYLGHEPFAVYNLFTKDGQNYGTLMASHKATLAGSGDKMDPISRTLDWIANTGRINFSEKNANYRLINQGHSHIWEIAMAFNGLYICAGPSLEAIDKEVDNPWKTDSSFGLMVGFMKSVPGATKQYIPPKGPITFEFLHEGLLGRIFKEEIAEKYEEIFKKLPAKVAIKI